MANSTHQTSLFLLISLALPIHAMLRDSVVYDSSDTANTAASAAAAAAISSNSAASSATASALPTIFSTQATLSHATSALSTAYISNAAHSPHSNTSTANHSQATTNRSSNAGFSPARAAVSSASAMAAAYPPQAVDILDDEDQYDHRTTTSSTVALQTRAPAIPQTIDLLNEDTYPSSTIKSNKRASSVAVTPNARLPESIDNLDNDYQYPPRANTAASTRSASALATAAASLSEISLAAGAPSSPSSHNERNGALIQQSAQSMAQIGETLLVIKNNTETKIQVTFQLTDSAFESTRTVIKDECLIINNLFFIKQLQIAPYGNVRGWLTFRASDTQLLTTIKESSTQLRHAHILLKVECYKPEGLLSVFNGLAPLTYSTEFYEDKDERIIPFPQVIAALKEGAAIEHRHFLSIGAHADYLKDIVPAYNDKKLYWEKRLEKALAHERSGTSYIYSSAEVKEILQQLEASFKAFDHLEQVRRKVSLTLTVNSFDHTMREMFMNALRPLTSMSSSSLTTQHHHYEQPQVKESYEDISKALPLPGHTNLIISSFGCHGQFLLTGSVDHTVRLWNVNRFPEVSYKRVSEHASALVSVQISTQAPRGLCISADKTARVIDFSDFPAITVIELPKKIDFGVISSDGNKIMTGKKARIWDISNLNKIAQDSNQKKLPHEKIDELSSFIRDGQFTPDGQSNLTDSHLSHTITNLILYAHSQKGAAPDRLQLQALSDNKKYALFLEEQGDNKLTFRIADLQAELSYEQFDITGNEIHTARFSTQGSFILILVDAHVGWLIDIKNFPKIEAKRLPTRISVWSFSADDRFLLTAYNNQIVDLFDLQNFPMLSSKQLAENVDSRITNLTISSRNQCALVLKENNTVQIWNIASFPEISPLQLPEFQNIYSIHFSTCGRFAYVEFNDRTAKLFNITEFPTVYAKPIPEFEKLSWLKLSADSRFLLLAYSSTLLILPTTFLKNNTACIREEFGAPTYTNEEFNYTSTTFLQEFRLKTAPPR